MTNTTISVNNSVVIGSISNSLAIPKKVIYYSAKTNKNTNGDLRINTNGNILVMPIAINWASGSSIYVDLVYPVI